MEDEFLKFVMNDTDEVDQIIDIRKKDNRIQYLVRWKDNSKENSWEYNTDLSCGEKIFQFLDGRNDFDNLYLNGSEQESQQNKFQRIQTEIQPSEITGENLNNSKNDDVPQKIKIVRLNTNEKTVQYEKPDGTIGEMTIDECFKIHSVELNKYIEEHTKETP